MSPRVKRFYEPRLDCSTDYLDKAAGSVDADLSDLLLIPLEVLVHGLSFCTSWQDLGSDEVTYLDHLGHPPRFDTSTCGRTLLLKFKLI